MITGGIRFPYAKFPLVNFDIGISYGRDEIPALDWLKVPVLPDIGNSYKYGIDHDRNHKKKQWLAVFDTVVT